MSNSLPLISIIIPVYNAESFISETIQSVLDQTYSNLEVIAIDDGSNDNSRKILKQFPQIKYYFQPQQGNAVARNQGIYNSQGEYICFLDCDDIYPSDKISRQYAFLASHPQSLIVSGRTKEFLHDNNNIPTWVRKRALPSAHSGSSPGTLMMKRQIFDIVGYFNPEFSLINDTEWLIRLKQFQIELQILPEVVLYKRIHAHNQSAHSSPELIQRYHHELTHMFYKSLSHE